MDGDEDLLGRMLAQALDNLVRHAGRDAGACAHRHEAEVGQGALGDEVGFEGIDRERHAEFFGLGDGEIEIPEPAGLPDEEEGVVPLADRVEVAGELVAIALARGDRAPRGDHDRARGGRSRGLAEPVEALAELFDLECVRGVLRGRLGSHDGHRERLADRRAPALEGLGLGASGGKPELGEREGREVFRPRGTIEARADVDLHRPGT